ncbi:MAG: GNAT family N-acetyltransferase [Microlunatus sp.]|nr:GNAT family N-acetyltransferase [Microlunatus sp.]
MGQQTTWDGIPIASDPPPGSAIVVRRADPQGAQYLLLHRAEHGPDHAGDWAWTAPSGARQPGEPVYPAALRKLAEETGIREVRPWPLDLSDPSWAVWGLDLGAGTQVRLVDVEHDRFVWRNADAAAQLILPCWVAEQQIGRSRGVPFCSLAFRRMSEDDVPSVIRWQQSAHAAPWFGSSSPDLTSAIARYRPRLDGTEPVRMWVVQVDGRPAGYLQDYRLGDRPDAARYGDPNAAGFDYLLGEPDLIQHGVGTRMVWEFCRDVLHRDYPDAAHFVAAPNHRNHRSRRVLAKCGFTEGLWIDEPAPPGEPPETEVVCSLDVAHWLGPAVRRD